MRKLIIIIAILLIAGLALWWWWKSSYKEKTVERLTPGVGLVTLYITDIDNERIKLISKVTISNPLPVDIHARDLTYKIFIDSIKVIESNYNKPLSILSSDSTLLEFPMEILATPMSRVLKHFENVKADSADYTMEATIDMNVPIAGERTFNMKMTKRGPAIFIPKVKVLDVDLNGLRIKKKGVDMKINVTNPNSNPIKLKDGKFTFSIPGDMEIKGVLEKIVDIPARGSETISIHTDVEEVKILKTGWDFVADKKDTRYKSTFSCIIIADNNALNNSKMNMTIEGTLDEIINAAEKMSSK